MSVGNQSTKASVDQTLSSVAVQLRNVMQMIDNLNTQVNGGGAGLAYLQGIGYGNTSNPGNPGSQSDAAYAETIIGYMNTVKGVYEGTVQQGGSGGTGASTFDFDTALAPLWAGQ